MRHIMTKGIAATVLVGAAVSGATASANAATPAHHPHPQPVNPLMISTTIIPGVTYTGDSKDGRAQITTPWGTLRTAPGQAAISDANGHPLFGNPQTTGVTPLDAQGRTTPAPATLSPTSSNWHPVDEPEKSGKPKTQAQKNDDIQSSINNVATNFGFATAVGAFVGGVSGAVIGCPVGAVTGGLATLPVFPVSPVAAVLGCVLGAGAVGGLGVIIGGAVVGVPVGIASGIYEYQRLHANGDV
ncbi:hypothetical protein HUN08_06905 [Gordonia sp. X0973]|nr:hypothetical protein HUN08_06905 [Gordonia sp. X0973]